MYLRFASLNATVFHVANPLLVCLSTHWEGTAFQTKPWLVYFDYHEYCKCFYVPSLCSSPEKATGLGRGFGVALRSLVLNINMSTSAADTLMIHRTVMGGAASAPSLVIVNDMAPTVQKEGLDL